MKVPKSWEMVVHGCRLVGDASTGDSEQWNQGDRVIDYRRIKMTIW